MTVHTILQVVCLFIIYTVLTVVLPELVFHQKYKGRRTGERLMLDITVSNFYIMNLVFILQLLHISSIYTLLIFTVMPVFAVIIIQYRKAFKAWGIRQLALLGKISSKTMGIKTFFAIVFTRIKDILCNACKNIFHIIGRHKTEYVLFTLLSVWLLYIYGSNEIIQYGYTVSDLPVHNYWINEMSKNNIFAAGVYPFGFHCIIYYIHTVFHIDDLCNSAAVFRGADLLSASGFVYLYPLHMPFFLCRLWWTVFISGSIIIPRQLYDPFYQRTAAGIRHAVYPAVYLLFIRIF